MKKFLKLLAVLSLSIASAQLQAIEIADIEIAPKVSIAGLDKPLQLNGAGIRYKFFFKVYVGALYLSEKQNNPGAILAGDKPNRVLMHFIYDEVSQEKLVNAWLEGFENNTDKAQMAGLKERLAQFNALFSTVHTGDVVLLDYVPGKGTTVNVKGLEKGVIEGADFNRALLAVWLGEEPVTEDLKEAMLGLE
ncbi:FIG026291: Hypothetical periplasmic protein [hydrothermal vent metagenome]|uniref:FIG026291: Hypothetical periplasmic protein n=1 Tax=hydrothermal vent metagenome TaxID=652676 RepID=A0A3B0Y6Z0_9ZZZZ